MEVAKEQNFSKKLYTAKDYISDGLVGLWDGIENAGWYEHDSNTSMWKNLISEQNINLNLGVNLHWNANSLHRTVEYGDLITPCDVAKKDYTVQIVIDNQSDATQKQNPRIFGAGNTSRRFEIDVCDSIASMCPRILYFYNKDSSKTFSASFGRPVNGKWFLTYSIGSNGSFFIIESACGKTWIAPEPIAVDFYAGTKLYVGSWGAGMSSALLGDIYCLRVYDRQLTEDEIAENYEIDKMRFGI